MEEGSIWRTLAFDCGYGYAQEEYVVKRKREADVEQHKIPDPKRRLCRWTLPEDQCVTVYQSRK